MSPARRYTIRLYRWGLFKRETDTNLDPRDDGRLRELLEQQIKAQAGSLRGPIDAGWELRIHSEGGGRIHARVTVDPSGRTVVKR